MYVCIWLIHSVVQQKLRQHCKAIIFQIKKFQKKINKGDNLQFGLDEKGNIHKMDG